MRAALIAGTSILVVTLTQVPSAAAQVDDEVIGEVAISFDVGEYDEALDDWPITAVVVTGDLEDGQAFTVQLSGTGGEVLWSATQEHADPSTRVEVVPPVAVAAVARADISHPVAVVGGVQIEPPQVEWSASGGGGSGQLALSVILAILIVAIVFRTPLPSATTQRWTK